MAKRSICAAVGMISVVLMACRDNGEAVSDRAVELRTDSLLIVELRAIVSRSDVPVVIQRANVHFVNLGSGAVPDLIYRWAIFRSERVTHASAYAVAGMRAGRPIVLRDPGDWSEAAAGWGPRDSASAVVACTELIRTTAHLGPYSPLRPYRGSGPSIDDLLPGDSIVLTKRIEEPLVVRHPQGTDGNWILDIWMMQPTLSRLATRYACQLPRVLSRSEPAHVAVLDSVPRAGLPATQ